MSIEDSEFAEGRTVFAVAAEGDAVRGARPAVAAFSSRLGLWDADGHLSQGEEADPLWRALGEAAAMSAQAGQAMICQVPIDLDPRVQDLDVVAIPESGDRPPTLAIVVRVRVDIAEALTRLYGFTRSEAEVTVALAEGQSLSEIAYRRGAGRAMARSQIRTALTKAGLRREADLAALAVRLRSPADA
jgi:DNA-binding CsgD family transcriptional regulator